MNRNDTVNNTALRQTAPHTNTLAKCHVKSRQSSGVLVSGTVHGTLKELSQLDLSLQQAPTSKTIKGMQNHEWQQGRPSISTTAVRLCHTILLSARALLRPLLQILHPYTVRNTGRHTAPPETNNQQQKNT